MKSDLLNFKQSEFKGGAAASRIYAFAGKEHIRKFQSPIDIKHLLLLRGSAGYTYKFSSFLSIFNSLH